MAAQARGRLVTGTSVAAGTNSPAAGAAPRGWLATERARLAVPMVAFALIAMAALGYLALVKLTNASAVCFVIQGCDTVQASKYSTFMSIPVAMYGLAMATVVLVAVAAWWRTGDRRLLYVPYGLGLIGLFVIAGLVYVELFVIHAICVWCVTAAASLVFGWVVSVIALRRAGAAR
ncbi:MAG: vitamin K epoxide reductase family protein [Candidatus Limnocylindrales bacterium]|jgi:uncharacterized membrane protein